MSTITERVQRGHAWLRANRADKIANIDTSTLNVADLDLCPLGQTGGYFHGAVETSIQNFNVWAIEHGFEAESRVDPQTMSFDSMEYQKLTEAWITELESTS